VCSSDLLESRNGAYIDAGMEYKDRKELLKKLYGEKYLPKLEQNP